MLTSLKLGLWNNVHEQVAMDVVESFWDSIRYDIKDQVLSVIGGPFTWVFKSNIRDRLERQLEEDFK